MEGFYHITKTCFPATEDTAVTKTPKIKADAPDLVLDNFQEVQASTRKPDSQRVIGTPRINTNSEEGAIISIKVQPINLPIR